MPLIDINGISVGYNGVPVLTDVNLRVEEEDFLGVVGPNGGGKTTLIKAIMGMVEYTGRITYDNDLCRNGRPAIGYLPQQERFDAAFPIPVREVILSGLQSGKKLTGRYTRRDLERADMLMETSGIKHVADKGISKVSGGQMQRALLCRALISDPRLIILDEPANFVDNNFEKELYELLRRLNRDEKKAVIMVSHDLGTISSVVKNIVCVNGKVHRHGSNRITAEQLRNYDCPIQLVYHGHVPHTVLAEH